MTTYQVVIRGLKPGQNRDEALQRLAATFKQPVERLSSLVNGTRAVVKRGADIALAAKLQAAIDAAGFESVVEPEVSEAPMGSAANVNRQAASAAQAPSVPSRVPSPRPDDSSALGGATSSNNGTAANTPVMWGRVAIFALAAIAIAIALAITKPFSSSSSSLSLTKETSAMPANASRDAHSSVSNATLIGSWQCAKSQNTYMHGGGFKSVSTETTGSVSTVVTVTGTFEHRQNELVVYLTHASFRPPMITPTGMISEGPITGKAIHKLIELNRSTMKSLLVGATNPINPREWMEGDPNGLPAVCTRL